MYVSDVIACALLFLRGYFCPVRIYRFPLAIASSGCGLHPNIFAHQALVQILYFPSPNGSRVILNASLTELFVGLKVCMSVLL